MLIFEAENVSQSITMVESLGKRRAALQAAGVFLSATLGATTLALAQKVNDLPGGPAVHQLNFAPAVTQIAHEQAWLHWFMMAICLVIFVIVFGVMFYSILKHRKSVGHKAQTLSEPIWVELGWTIVPLLIVIGMALPATKVLVAQKDTTNSDLTIKATGMQWKWGYDYLRGEGEGIGFVSTLDVAQRNMSDRGQPSGDDYLLKVDNPLVVPVNKKIRIITTANDVIHAFAVPAFGVQQDAIPGFVRDAWFRAEKTGDFYGQCAKLCGKEHSYMPIHVKVLSTEAYSSWVQGKQKEIAAKADDPGKVWALDALAARGEKVYNANCAVCHQPNGKGAGPIKPIDGAAVVNDADKTKQIMVLLNGQNNGAMPSWKTLSDTAVVTFTKNHWSNKTGQIVQPADVVAARK